MPVARGLFALRPRVSVSSRSRKLLQEGQQVKAKHLAILSTVVLAACTGQSDLNEANTKIAELQVKVVDLQTEISHLRKTNAELNSQLQKQR